MSAASSECWAASRHLAVACPLRETCEATTRERDGLMAEVVRLRSLIDGMAERAERTPADDLRDDDGEG